LTYFRQSDVIEPGLEYTSVAQPLPASETIAGIDGPLGSPFSNNRTISPCMASRCGRGTALIK
jgi:hypothetical protein